MANVVILIRHAEKPLPGATPQGITADGRPDEESLTTRGWQRAGALVPYFVSATDGPGVSGLPVPSQLIASQIGPQSSSARPAETLAPLAARLGLRVETRFLKNDIGSLLEALRAGDGVALVSWEHHLIPSIALDLVGRASIVPEVWPDDRYDLTWVLDSSTSGPRFAFRQIPQLLLAGDLSSTIGLASDDAATRATAG